MEVNIFNLTVTDLNNNRYMIQCYGYQNSIEYLKFILASDLGIHRQMIDLYFGETKLED